MILYIHGFGSSGLGSKAKTLRENLQKELFLAPSLSYVPKLAINTLEQIIQGFQRYEEVKLIGSSLGGFYALYLADKLNLKAVLINPALKAPKDLELGVNKGVNYFDMSHFEFNHEHLESLKSYVVNEPKNKENYLVLVKKGDEVIDYRTSVTLFKDSEGFILEEGGNHAFEDIKKYSAQIEKHFSQKA